MDVEEFVKRETYRGMAYHMFFNFDNEGKPNFGLTPDRELDGTAINELDKLFKEHFEATTKLDTLVASMGDTNDYSEVDLQYQKVDGDLYTETGGVLERLVNRRLAESVKS